MQSICGLRETVPASAFGQLDCCAANLAVLDAEGDTGVLDPPNRLPITRCPTAPRAR
jgi:hypothetical protein